jgi:glycosyltransferase involved in cell wall biosynthesis
VFAIPGSLDTATGGYAYDREIVARLPAHGLVPQVIELGDGFPKASTETCDRAAALLLAVPAGQPIVVDGLALGVLPEAAEGVSARNPLIGLVHHPLANETGVTQQCAEALRHSERKALAAARAVITTSAFTARLLADEFAVAREKMTVIRPGCAARVGRAATREPRDVVRLLAVGSLVPRKGHDVLLAALARLRDLPWRLTIVGDARDRVTTADLRDFVKTSGLADRVTFAGAVSDAELQTLYASADAFVLASHFEGYGMAFAEALAHGLPIVGTTGGAIPETVPAAAALLVAPGDIAEFAAAVGRVVEDRALRDRLSAAASAAAAKLPTWDDAARDFAQVIASVA